MPRAVFSCRLLRRRRGAPGEGGHLLIGLMMLVAIMAILTGVGFQHWSIVERRDREQELLFIQKQYAMALLEWQHQMGQPPVKLEDLDQMTGLGKRVIRRMWLDPMTKDVEGGEEGIDRWCLIQQGPDQQVVNSCPQSGQEDFEIGDDAPPPVAQGQGLPIVGVASRSEEASYLLWNDRKHYNEWIYTTRELEQEGNQLAVFQ